MQAKAIRKGFNAVVPLGMLSLFSWREVETLVCGNPTIDVTMLRRHTRFNGGLSASSPVVIMLFEALKSFSADERRLFLRFVWGRNRLPPSDADFTQPFTLNTLASSGNEPQRVAVGLGSGGCAPHIHTCSPYDLFALHTHRLGNG